MTGPGAFESFNATSTGPEVVAGIDLRGKAAVVTGAASGIGVETARAPASTGASVTPAVRDVAAGEQVAARISSSAEGGHVQVRPLDLAELGSVAAFTAAWRDPSTSWSTTPA